MHNLLKGVRSLNAVASDVLLAKLGLTALDLLESDELRRALLLRSRDAEPSLEVPVLRDRLGPGLPWPDQPHPFERVRVPLRYVSRLQQPVVARLADDRPMTPLLNAGDLVLLDRSEARLACGDPEALFVVERAGQFSIRWIRSGRGRLYLLSALDRDRPRDWETIGAPAPAAILARAIPLRWMYRPEPLYDPLLLPRDIHREPAPRSSAS